jgi:hypothetical protein
MATLTVRSIVLNTTGTDVEIGGSNWDSAASAGDQFANPTTGTAFLLVDTSATTCTVTVASQSTCDQGSTHNIALSMGANETRLIGPFAPNRFEDSDGNVQITYSTVTDVNVCVIGIA